MGTWGTEILADDTAMDVADEFKALIAFGHLPEEAVQQLRVDFDIHDEEGDPLDPCPFWLGLAAKQVEMGRLTDLVKAKALRIIDEDIDLAIWKDQSPGDVNERRKHLSKLREQILGEQRPPTKVRKPFIDNIEWDEGDGLAYQLPSGKWTGLLVCFVERNHRYQEANYLLLDLLLEDMPNETQIREACTKLSLYTKRDLSRFNSPGINLELLFTTPANEKQRKKRRKHEKQMWKKLRFEMQHSIFTLSRSKPTDGPTGRLVRITTGLRGPGDKHKNLGLCFGGWKDLDPYLEKEYGLK